MKLKFYLSIMFGGIWLFISIMFGLWWAQDVSRYLPAAYVWWVIIGIALLPGFLMSSMFFSNLLHWKLKKYPNTCEDTTVIICARNEEATIAEAIDCVCQQNYIGHICLLVIDNCSTDNTKAKIMEACACKRKNCTIEYFYCGKPGKSNALNLGLSLVNTCHFITVDADTFLEKNAVQRIMNHIIYRKISCVAGNLFVQNTKASLITRMQNYDYLLSIAAIKRFQGSYRSTLVAQGAFSAFETKAVRDLDGWQDCLGEDIVLTYQLLEQGKISTYEPAAVGYTLVPKTLSGLYNQRKRWAIGMIESFSRVRPWQQGSQYSKYFSFVNLSIIYLDFAFMFGFIPGVIFALFGYYYFVGYLTLVALLVSVLLFFSMYIYQKKLHIPFHNSYIGFLFFILFFQFIQSSASLHGYTVRLLKGRGEWK